MRSNANGADVVGKSLPPEDIMTKSLLPGGFLNNKKKHRLLKALFGILLVTIILLGIVVGLNHLNLRSSKINVVLDDSDERNNAFRMSSVINDLFVMDAEYSFEDAKAEYNRQMTYRDNLYKISIALYYARFLIKYSGDLETAMQVIEDARIFLDSNDEDMMIGYYAALEELCKDLDKLECSEYEKKMEELTTVKNIDEAGFPIYE